MTFTAAAFALAVGAQDLVRIPASAHEVTDQITSLKVRVSVSEFLMGATEVTQREYEAITSATSANPSVYKGASRPIENVSWWDAIRYCNLRSAKEGLPACYDLTTGRREVACTGYRLPTEAEWIVAAGPKPSEQQLGEMANLGVSSTKAVGVLEAALKKGTAPVRSFQPNGFGLFDMRGNVWEWCGDYFDALASPDAVRDPSGPASGVARVIHGGSFVSTTSRWSGDYRSSMNAESRSRFTGFRVARSLEKKVAPPAASEAFFSRYNEAPQGFASSIGPLTALAPPGTSADAWKINAAKIRAKWDTLLKEPKFSGATLTSRVIRDISQRNFSGQMFELEMEPGVWEKIYVLRPSNDSRGPRPVIIVRRKRRAQLVREGPRHRPSASVGMAVRRRILLAED
jgi:formylglycine-generating enzyme required for sulfatase activity